jgi:hypothetical protein
MTLIRYVLMLVLVMLTQRGMAAPDASLRKSYDKARPYLLLVQQQPDWLTSRLQMYWHSHATDVFIDGEKLDHAGGQRAPVPTVRPQWLTFQRRHLFASPSGRHRALR